MPKNNKLLYALGFIILLCLITFPLHWVPSEKIVVPKRCWTLKNTFVSEEQVISIVEKYYLGSPEEKFEIYNDPLANRLKDNWKCYERGNEYILNSKDKMIRKHF